MSERSNQSPERGPWDDYSYNPAPSRPTGDPQRVLSGEGNVLTKRPDSPRVGVNGVDHALRVMYGSRSSLPAGRTHEPELVPGLEGPTVDLLLPRQAMPEIEQDLLGAPEEE